MLLIKKRDDDQITQQLMNIAKYDTLSCVLLYHYFKFTLIDGYKMYIILPHLLNRVLKYVVICYMISFFKKLIVYKDDLSGLPSINHEDLPIQDIYINHIFFTNNFFFFIVYF